MVHGWRWKNTGDPARKRVEERQGNILAALLPAAADMAIPTTGQTLWSEFLGTTILLPLGSDVVATNLLPKFEGKSGDQSLINWGWDLAVFVDVYVALRIDDHLNPAVTIVKVVTHIFDSNVTLAGDIFVTGINTAAYIIIQLLGVFADVVLCWLTFKKHFDEDCDSALKLDIFPTDPEIRSYGWNYLTEAIDTVVLILQIFASDYTETAAGPLDVALIIVVIDSPLGGPTGYAINPARDFGPRIAYAILPIEDKGGSDWGYSRVLVIGPIVGAIVGTVLYYLIFA